MKRVKFELDKNELFYIENISEYLMHSKGFLSNLMCKISEITVSYTHLTLPTTPYV